MYIIDDNESEHTQKHDNEDNIKAVRKAHRLYISTDFPKCFLYIQRYLLTLTLRKLI